MTRPKFKIQKDDQVVVIAGRDKGKIGQVKKVYLEEGRVLVEGINVVTKHVKPSQTNPEGGRQKKSLPIHVSNLMLVDGKGDRSRVAYKTEESGEKVRIFKTTGENVKK